MNIESKMLKTAKSIVSDPIDRLHGNFIFNVPGRTGLSVHSGRANSCDQLNRCGPNHATDGCIRTTDSATQLIQQLHSGGDPLTHIIVQ